VFALTTPQDILIIGKSLDAQPCRFVHLEERSASGSRGTKRKRTSNDDDVMNKKEDEDEDDDDDDKDVVMMAIKSSDGILKKADLSKKGSSVSVENNLRLLLSVIVSCFDNYDKDENPIICSEGLHWCNLVGCFIALSVDSKLRGAAIEIEKCVESITNSLIRNGFITSIVLSNTISQLISSYYVSIDGNALIGIGQQTTPEIVRATSNKRKAYRMVLKMLTNMYFVTTTNMLLLRYTIASKMLLDVLSPSTTSTTTSTTANTATKNVSFDAVAIAKKIVRIWKEGDDFFNNNSNDAAAADEIMLKTKNSAYSEESDYDDWGWLHDLLLMLRMCESDTFANTTTSTNNTKNSNKYGENLVEILSLIHIPTHQYDIDISALQQLHQNFTGQLKERSGRLWFFFRRKYQKVHF